jgi:2,3-bisphosphoglycerate-independent phosphoglycerate mutase
MAPSARALLIVLDGFGIGKDSPWNAIENAHMPFYKEIRQKYPMSQLLTHGAAVGLPDGVMGNSEVGHMTMGAGRIIYQDLVRITAAIADRSFFQNPVLRRTVEAGAKKTGRVHLMGLVSDGGVHSHLDHLLACLDLCLEMQVPEVCVHAFLDGRDTPPDSAPGYLKTLLTHPAFSKNAHLVSLQGRYYAMDRDKRWERIERAADALCGRLPKTSGTPEQAVVAFYASGKGDEFVEPVCFDPTRAMRSGDSVIFFNYRSDRARQITEFLTGPKGPGLSAFAPMTEYDKKLALEPAFKPQNLNNLFGKVLEDRGLRQFRIAETEKYAHVTFFFNGGREEPFRGEERILIPSPRDVETYDLKPEMSAAEVADAAVKRLTLAQDDFGLMNFANADMVGHTGVYTAAVRAMEALDLALGRVVGAAEKAGFHTLITADHGNAEEMCDHDGKPHTQHTLNPVPCLWVAPNSSIAPKSARFALRDGGLADLMPTLCELMGLPVPKEVTGKSLLPPGAL